MASVLKSAGAPVASSSTSDATLPPGSIEQATTLLEMISCLALTLRESMLDVGNAEESCAVAGYLASQIGWMADLGTFKLGGRRSYGDVEDWLLPRRYHEHTAVQAPGHVVIPQGQPQ